MLSEVRKDLLEAFLLLTTLTFLNFIFPYLSLLIYIFWPVPIAYIIVKHGNKEGMLLILLLALINGLMMGPLMGLYTIAGFGFIGFVLGSSLRENFSPLKTLILTILVVLVSNIIITLGSPYILNFSYEELFNELLLFLEQSPEFKDLGLLLQQQLVLVKRLLPAILTISSIISGILSYYAAIWYLRKKGIRVEALPPLREWRLPRWWLSLAIVFTLLFNNNIYLLNLNIILLFLASLQGFAVGLHYLNKSSNSGFLVFLFVFAVLLFNFLSLALLALLGLIDMWFVLRKPSG